MNSMVRDFFSYPSGPWKWSSVSFVETRIGSFRRIRNFIFEVLEQKKSINQSVEFLILAGAFSITFLSANNVSRVRSNNRLKTSFIKQRGA